MLVQHVAEPVLNPRHHHRVVVQPAGGERTVGRRHLEQRHVARAEAEGRYFVQRTLDAHPPCIERHLARIHELGDDARGDRVLRLRERVAERQQIARRRVVEVAGRPDLTGNRIAIRIRAVGQPVVRGPSVVDRGRVNERLECRARLPRRRYDVVVPIGREIAPADPCLDVPGVRIQRDHPCLQARLLGLQRIHERLVAAKLRKGLVGRRALSTQTSVVRRLTDEGVHEVAFRLPEVAERLVAGLPGVPVQVGIPAAAPGRAPFIVDDLLKAVHVLRNGLRGQFLHAGVERRVDPQTVRVQAVPVLSSPFAHPQAHLLGEVRREARGDLGGGVVDDFDGLFPVLLVKRRVQEAMPNHVVQYDVSHALRITGIPMRIVVRRRSEHADQRGRLERIQFARVLGEEGLGCRLDAECVLAERDRVQVHLDDLALRIAAFELHGRDPLLQLTGRRHVEADLLVVKIARQLLADGGSPSQLPLRNDVRCGGEYARYVDAPVAVESMVFGRDQGVDRMRRDLVIGHPRAVLEGIPSQLPVVGRVGDRGELEIRIVELLERRQVVHEKERPDSEHEQAQ